MCQKGWGEKGKERSIWVARTDRDCKADVICQPLDSEKVNLESVTVFGANGRHQIVDFSSICSKWYQTVGQRTANGEKRKSLPHANFTHMLKLVHREWSVVIFSFIRVDQPVCWIAQQMQNTGARDFCVKWLTECICQCKGETVFHVLNQSLGFGEILDIHFFSSDNGGIDCVTTFLGWLFLDYQ